MGIKKCIKCKEEKPLDNFYKRKKAKDGLRGECKDCLNPVIRNSKLKREYGISLKEWYDLFKKQNGVCGICKEPETSSGSWKTTSSLSVDHDHDTGKIRGLLCSCCNHAIGLLKDNKEYILNAYMWLKEND